MILICFVAVAPWWIPDFPVAVIVYVVAVVRTLDGLPVIVPDVLKVKPVGKVAGEIEKSRSETVSPVVKELARDRIALVTAVPAVRVIGSGAVLLVGVPAAVPE